MTAEEDDLPGEEGADLLEDAPCGYLSLRPDGTIVWANRTFEAWTGRTREELAGRERLPDLLAPGGRIYWETHLAPLLHMQGHVREIAVDLVRADGSRLPALLNAVVRRDGDGRPRAVRAIVLDATDRRRYEDELLAARRRERRLLHQLQRALLPGEPPIAPGLQIAAAYRPAVRGLDVGGDWHDAFWLEEGSSVGLVMGDVVGRGVEAAATMGQLRSAVRALASTGLDPGPLLDALDAYARRHSVGRMTTLVYARLELGDGLARVACAGHPPPLVCGPDGEAAYVWEGRSLPLDAFGSAGPRPQHEMRLTPGSVVLLYTDGLVETRERPLHEGMEALRGVVSRGRGGSAAAIVGAAAAALATPEHYDDVCALAVRLTAA